MCSAVVSRLGTRVSSSSCVCVFALWVWFGWVSFLCDSLSSVHVFSCIDMCGGFECVLGMSIVYMYMCMYMYVWYDVHVHVCMRVAQCVYMCTHVHVHTADTQHTCPCMGQHMRLLPNTHARCCYPNHVYTILSAVVTDQNAWCSVLH